mgnify:CR=1 FL=1
MALCGAVFVSCLVAATFIDLDHFIIPDVFTVGLGQDQADEGMSRLVVGHATTVFGRHHELSLGAERDLLDARLGALQQVPGHRVLLFLTDVGHEASGARVD